MINSFDEKFNRVQHITDSSERQGINQKNIRKIRQTTLRPTRYEQVTAGDFAV
jgi:hypothetical protein